MALMLGHEWQHVYICIASMFYILLSKIMLLLLLVPAIAIAIAIASDG
jgi:ABC-type long-subunit fatty acid transport system fused permease/ATPase subunit